MVSLTPKPPGVIKLCTVSHRWITVQTLLLVKVHTQVLESRSRHWVHDRVGNYGTLGTRQKQGVSDGMVQAPCRSPALPCPPIHNLVPVTFPMPSHFTALKTVILPSGQYTSRKTPPFLGAARTELCLGFSSVKVCTGRKHHHNGTSPVMDPGSFGASPPPPRITGSKWIVPGSNTAVGSKPT